MLRPSINDYIKNGKDADRYLADLRAYGEFVSDRFEAKIGSIFEQYEAYTPYGSQETRVREKLELGFMPPLKYPLRRHINPGNPEGAEYSAQAASIRTELRAKLDKVPGGKLIRDEYVDATGTIELSFDVKGERVTTGIQPGRYGYGTIDWGTSVIGPTSVMKKEGRGWGKTDCFTPAESVARALLRATRTNTPEEAEDALERAKIGFANLSKFPGVTQSRALRQRLGNSQRYIFRSEYAPSPFDIYKQGGDGSILDRNRLTLSAP